MQNTNPNALVRLGDLVKPPFKQLPDGTITIDFSQIPPEALDNSVAAVLQSLAVSYIPDAVDPVNLGVQRFSLAVTDESTTPTSVIQIPVLDVPVIHQYDTTGEYIGSMLSAGLPNLT